MSTYFFADAGGAEKKQPLGMFFSAKDGSYSLFGRKAKQLLR